MSRVTDQAIKSFIQEPDGLCKICRKIDFDEIFQRKVKVQHGAFIANLKASPTELKASHCVMCQLFGAVAPSDLNKDGSARTEGCHLRAYSANRVFASFSPREMLGIDDVTLLGIARVNVASANSSRDNSSTLLRESAYETGYLCSEQACQSSGIINVRPISPDAFDRAFVKSCLAYCRANHRPTCQVARASTMKSLRVIDCYAWTIINAPIDCHYVALSYLWGVPGPPAPDTQGKQNSGSALGDAPKVIIDCIEVLLQLGLRYLWVDRYCIDQNDQNDMHIQIRQMDLIYANAHLTIIAAAGQDPQHGLSGVRGTWRKPQLHLAVSHHSLISTLPGISWAVEDSKWSSRGWTYQEGLLSRRRLIFTKYQTYYECNGMHCAESVALPLDKLHVKSRKTFRELTSPGSFRLKTPGSKPWEIMAYIAGFNERNLTFSRDALDAIQGVLNAFASGSRSVHHFIGVPIPPPEAASRNGRSYRHTSRTAEECFVVGLSWFHRFPGERRGDFPSWSWAGWYGQLAEGFQVSQSSLDRFENLEIWLESDDNNIVRFPSWDYLPDFLSGYQSDATFLHIVAPVIFCPIVHLNREYVLRSSSGADWFLEHYGIERDGCYVEFQLDKDTILYERLYLDQNIANLGLSDKDSIGRYKTAYTGIIFEGSRNGFVMVVDKKDAFAERLGLFRLSDLANIWHHEGLWTSDTPSKYRSDGSSLGDAKKILASIPQARRRIRLG